MHLLARSVVLAAILGSSMALPSPAGAGGPAWDMLALVAKEPGPDRTATTGTGASGEMRDTLPHKK